FKPTHYVFMEKGVVIKGPDRVAFYRDRLVRVPMFRIHTHNKDGCHVYKTIIHPRAQRWFERLQKQEAT
ncbi:hypothetical protein, partial [Roseibium sp. RKSG952]|uniref:hypothetical protein n=1 Tax=Roseibium sp. RKSG952 TaxID=2529384 RepID=UPI0018AD1B55